LNEQLRLLVRFQEIDSAILSIAERIEALPGRLEKVKTSIKDVYNSYGRAKARYEELNKKKKSKEYELEEVEVKIKKLKERTREIKTNKEYEAHLKEIEATQKNKSRIEDEILFMMESLDALMKDLKSEEIEVRRSEENQRHEEKILEEEKKNLHSEMETYKAKRRGMVREIDEEIYKKYMGLMKTRGGIAVVAVKKEVCLGCHTNIPPQLYNDIKNNHNILTCYHCGRILYYRMEDEGEGRNLL